MCKVAYVVKRYPRFSETFVVNELLAHEQAGLELELFSLRPPVDTHFQDLISRVRAPLTYLSSGNVKAMELWGEIQQAQRLFPDVVRRLGTVAEEDLLDAYCGLRLAVACLQRDVTHLHAHFASSAAAVARIASKLSGIPYSLTAHAKDIYHDSVSSNDLQRKMEESVVTFTVSDFNVRHLQQKFGATAAAKVTRLYNGMHLDQFPYHSPHDRDPRIIAVGRFVEKKGFADLIDACSILRAQGRPFCCQIVGSGELQAELEAKINALRLQGEVRLLGPQPQSVVKQLIANASVMAAPCILGSDGNRDGLPTVLLEAMALGTPCVATDVTGIPEVILDDQTGARLLPQHDPQALAQALQKLLADSELRVRLALAARDLLAREFDAGKNAAEQRRYFGTESPGIPQGRPGVEQLIEV